MKNGPACAFGSTNFSLCYVKWYCARSFCPGSILTNEGWLPFEGRPVRSLLLRIKWNAHGYYRSMRLFVNSLPTAEDDGSLPQSLGFEFQSRLRKQCFGLGSLVLSWIFVRRLVQVFRLIIRGADITYMYWSYALHIKESKNLEEQQT